MEIVAFWLGCAGVWLYFTLTTTTQRHSIVRSGWTILLIAGALGALWEAAH